MTNQKKGISLSQVIAIVLSVSLILMLALYTMGRASGMAFWIAMAVAAIVAYYIIPPLREKEK